MSLRDRVRINRRFQRSIRIDTDLGTPEALEGFVCPESSANVLLDMARHVSETGQGAFTWTGPYGSGKSSLVIALSAVLNGNKALQKHAAGILGKRVSEKLWKQLPTGSKGWRIAPVVGRRDRPAKVIGEALEAAGLVTRRREWTDEKVLDAIVNIADEQPKTYGGLVLFIDEMGKFLEAAAQDDTDVYLFQQLAEAASRSKRRLIVVGILHQAFDEYAHRLSREIRDEWTKIHGRFVDLAINTGGEEQIELLSRAIQHSGAPKSIAPLAKSVADIIRKNRSSASSDLADVLANCWPLHPVVACLLGPISRRRFGQNQRSVFAFLNSAEPNAFQDFLKNYDEKTLYEPTMLWDYLRANLEPSILASPDGHRWAQAADAVERCAGLGGDELHIRLLKTIAVIDLFKERSGLVASPKLIMLCEPQHSESAIEAALGKLTRWKLIAFRKFVDAYVIYEGSDFDIDRVLEATLEEVREIDFKSLRRLSGLQPLLAKRHYHDTGALRWFDVTLAPVNQLIYEAEKFTPTNGTIGKFILAVPTEGEAEEFTLGICREAAKQNHDWDVVVGLSHRSWSVVKLARELIALEKVRDEHPELQGDPVAKREVEARMSVLQAQLEADLRRAYDNAEWYCRNHKPKRLPNSELNSLASDLADKKFHQSPRLNNELLNRIKPSSNAVAAQNALLKAMVMKEGEPRLGIEGFPAEGGLFASLLESTGLYSKSRNGWNFAEPKEEGEHRLAHVWKAAEDHLKANSTRAVSAAEIYGLWGKPPYGVRAGVMPVLLVAFLLSKRDAITFYREGIFQARFKDLDVDFLINDPADVQLRWLDLSQASRRLLSGMADVVRAIDKTNPLTHLKPIDVARGLVAIYENLHPWVRKTTRLSANAMRVRGLLKQSHDPNKMLFDDIPSAFSKAGLSSDEGIQSIVSSVQEGLEELVQTYPQMLGRIRELLLAELQVPNSSSQAMKELRARAENIRQVAGDFRLEAFVGRIARFDGSDGEIEGLASLAAEKPPRDWIDLDLDRASVEITAMAQKFVRAEAFASVKGRPNKRHAMAVVVGMAGRPAPVIEEFDVLDGDKSEIQSLAAMVEKALNGGNVRNRQIVLAALAQVAAEYMGAAHTPERGHKRKVAR